MQEIFSLSELTVLRQALNVITIQGKDAKPIALLQDKLESLIIQQEISQQESKPTAKKS
jgi:hypothetical protein